MVRRYHRRYRRYRSKNIIEQFIESFLLMLKELFVFFGTLIFNVIRALWDRYKVPKLEMISLDRHIVPFTSNSQAPGALYSLKKSPMTATEAAFLSVLERVVADRYRIVPQVGLSALVRTVHADPYKNYGDFNRIKAKSIDFVLYDENYRPFLAIELDDRSHLRLNRIVRDQFVNNVMQNVGLRILHVQVRSSYDEEWLREQIFFEFEPVETSTGWVRKK